VGEPLQKGYKVKINIIICFLLGILVSANASDTFEMVLIPAGTNSGTNSLGTTDTGAEVYSSTYPENYSLTVPKSFYMSSKEVTLEQFNEAYNWGITNGYQFTGTQLGRGSQIDQPVNSVSWEDAVRWCNARSQMDGLDYCYSNWICDPSKNGYRLPTTEEFQYAARGGLVSKRFPWGDTVDYINANYYGNLTANLSYDLSDRIWTNPTYHYNPTPYSSPVGSFAPNGYGLYDMGGNMQEWCYDAKSDDPALKSLLGGTWLDHAEYMRCGFYGYAELQRVAWNVGFRFVTSEWHFAGTVLYIR
jgi:formylglycine-generating enzyme required for sulfatase activity